GLGESRVLGHLRRAGGMIGLAESLLLVRRKPVVILPLVRGHISLEERDLAVAIGECLGNRSLHFLVLGAVIDIEAQRLGHQLKHCGMLLVDYRRRPPFNGTTASARLPSSAAAIRPPIASEARHSGSASRSAYRCVVDAGVCPISCPVTGKPTPPPTPTHA